MLCQLVCVDKRYQRMNCFNIREIQSILKKKFFPDLVNSHDYHQLLNSTAIGLRFKTPGASLIAGNAQTYYNYGLEITPKTKLQMFSHEGDSVNLIFQSFQGNTVPRLLLR